ncbi:MAG: leucyl aminopeptidase [Acidimicrobiia bacterium]|nr:leucyl aminopeptidase [Acidimicrobiia bacterium]
MPVVTAASSVPRSATAVDRPVATDELDSLDPEARRAAELQGFEGKVGQTLPLPTGGKGPIEVLVGIGSRAEVGTDDLRKAAAAFARAVGKHNSIATNLVGELPDDDRADAIAAVVEGAALASYRYNTYKSKPNGSLERIAVVAKGRGMKAEVQRASAVVDAVALARDLSNEPGGSLTPEAFAAKAKEVGAAAGLKVTVWDERKIAREKLGGLQAVNQGSVNPARFVRLQYTPAKRTRSRVALVGKGITFDSGGLSLKTANGMATMKVDMSGGGAVLAAMSVLGPAEVPVAVDGYIPLTDNMTGGDAQRPGDVFTARNGKTVEVLNTDAEGRLVLADALSLAAEDQPDAIIDIATLTGSASAALGTAYAALMATDDDVAARIEAASVRTDEKIWRLPLPPEYRPQLDSAVADLKNIGAGPYGGALVAGLFLKEFAGDTPWAHIDLGMSAMTDADRDILVKGATGFGVRLLVDVLAHWDG